ncbi:AglZ/HisF2 family acetamidino modification protein [Bdellovibrio sp. HCB117]|uniref:AglZ/HisF2 family acetamidino modification protein n=1 Tax=Bdellovibrio sp. HCB117 TaxID=3394359 RepID=UPI0039B6E86E
MNSSRTRIIPVLLLKGESLVKTVKFDKYNYIGDPINTVRIFNELEVDELAFLDIEASKKNSKPNFKLLELIASECFMPLAYGGGIKTFDDVKRIFSIGFEKVILNSICFEDPNLITKVSEIYGSQAVIGSVDYKHSFWGKAAVYSHDGTRKQNVDPKSWALELESKGVGEILLTSMDNDGTWNGFDVKVAREVSDSLSVPLIASGGAGSIKDIADIVKSGGASAVGVGSMVVYQKKDMGVLINFPDKKKLKEALEFNV